MYQDGVLRVFLLANKNFRNPQQDIIFVNLVKKQEMNKIK